MARNGPEKLFKKHPIKNIENKKEQKSSQKTFCDKQTLTKKATFCSKKHFLTQLQSRKKTFHGATSLAI